MLSGSLGSTCYYRTELKKPSSCKEDAPSPSAVAVREPPPSAPNTARFRLVLTGLLVSSFVAVLEGYAVSTALPVIVSDLHADQFI
ncbi:uncharacterized protein BXZ73DRAFT_105209 [Epithele typhae]|uniref:uncharacterized protein n=1 Tax=Epithele typhae TaxID=378194 RepID=UPI002007B4F8|nr:uncharacterized protein BXZ73DRAFT_105209 [Epithele typhae]KAH9918574.1 hypothetical protein BXZ73DRAFT_105209 [Epithele typhae]